MPTYNPLDKPVSSGFVFNPPKPCRVCGEAIDTRRAALSKSTCLECQADLDKQNPTQHLVAIPYNKGAYQYIHNPAELFQTNPKQPR
jgi:hypothetical protein